MIDGHEQIQDPRSYSKKKKKKRKGGTNWRRGEGRWDDLSKEYVCRQPVTQGRSSPRAENSMILPLPGTSSSRHPRRILDFRHSSPFTFSLSRDFSLLLSLYPGRHRCLQAPVCTYIYNNVTHTPRPRLFLLFRVAARGGSRHGGRGSIAWFRQSGGRARSGR